MASVEPYAPCPCGSGQKFKWCCQKVESYADKALRLEDNGQHDAALATLDEGLRKVPDNAWLLTRKALIHARNGRLEAARDVLRRVVAGQPGHLGAQSFLVRLVLEAEGSEAGVAQLQQAASAAPEDQRAGLGILFQLVGAFLAEEGHVPAARKHLEQAGELLGDEPMVESALRAVEGNAGVFPWLRNPDELGPAPDGLDEGGRARFDEALGWAGQGMWSSAAAAFEVLAADGVDGADRNLGLCRLWTVDDSAAVEAIRRHIARLDATPEAVDLEALCQLVAPPGPEDQVEHVHKIWTLRRRDELLAALRAADRSVYEGKGPLDPDDPKSFEVEQFALLDRPKTEGVPGGADDVPRVVGRVLVGRDIVILDTYDDGRLDGVMAQLAEIAGHAIPPAHPKTKVIDRPSRLSLALQVEMWLPEGTDRVTARRLNDEQQVRVVREVWPETPMPYLAGRTPRQAAQAGDAEVPLRAAVGQLEVGQEFFHGIDFAAMRAELRIPDEPPIDPATVAIESLHIARLHRVPADQLDDDRLLAMWSLSRRFVLPMAMERAARALVDRPSLLDRPEFNRVSPFSDLANLALSRNAKDEAFSWIERGRRDEPAASRPRNAVRWDMAEVRLRARTEAPEQWVPMLAVALDRYRDDREANSSILSNLVDMGLIQLAPNPDDPEQMLLDTRPLTSVLARYGPKVTTATGELGISAAKGGIWTPGGPTGGSGPGGGIWTPGSGPAAPAPGGEKPSKLIIPGR